MKPLIHAKISVKKYGGKIEDYLAFHNWFDQTKAFIPDSRHRMILHNSMGIFLLEQQFGTYMKNSDGNEVSIRDIGEDHVLQDLGFIPTVDRCFASMKVSPWMLAGKTTKERID